MMQTLSVADPRITACCEVIVSA